MRYRPHVDGLRAFAILTVIFFHVHLVPGGYIGVDVFFVLSGYLITAIVRDQIAAHTFSLPAFYLRRLRRLFPALAATLCITLLASCLFLGIHFAATLANPLLAALASVSNLLLANQDYFDDAAHTNPLLHTWSLAVEEQFYLVWPPFLAAVYAPGPRKRLVGLLVLALTAASLIAAQLALRAGPATHVFYYPHFRAWEFLVGALLCWIPSDVQAKTPAAFTESLALAAFAMLAVPVWAYTEHTPFPGVTAAVPCVATALLIFIGERSCVVRVLLNNRVARWIGRVSYSLYLVHWPVIVLVRMANKDERLYLKEKVIAVVLTVVLGVALFYCVEEPFRRGKRGGVRGLVGAVLGLCGMCGCVMLASWMEQVESRSSAYRGNDVLQALGGMYVDEPRANSSAFPVWFPKIIQREVGAHSNETKALIIGDSHAGRLLAFAAYLGKKYGVRFYVSSYPACSPLYGVRKIMKSAGVGQGVVTEEYLHNCKAVVNGWKWVVDRGEWDVVFLVSRWSTSVEPGAYGDTAQLAEMRLVDTEAGGDKEGDLNESRRVFERALNRTVRDMKQKVRNVVVVSEVPDTGRGLFQCKKKVRTGIEQVQPEECVAVDERTALNRIRYTDEVVRRCGAESILPSRYFCEGKAVCRAVSGSNVLYRDSNHLEDCGAMYLAMRWEMDRKAWFPNWAF